MPDAPGQGISVGDAVLTFLGDTTQLDAAFDRVATQAEVKMATAAGAVGQVGDAMDAVGPSATAAGEQISRGMERARSSTYEAKGEAALLGEMFGIHLPRHVRSFVAELPGIGTALSAAFSATAVLFLIEALAQGIEKIQEWADHANKVAAAWDQYAETMFESSNRMQGEIDKLQQKFVEMTQGPVAGLDFELKHLRSTSTETFSLMIKDIEAAVAAMNLASSSLLGIQFNTFKDAGKDLQEFRNELQKTMREAEQAAPNNPFAGYNAGIEVVKQKERDLTALIKQRTAASGADASAAVGGLHAERQAVNDLLPMLQRGIDLQKEKIKVLQQERSDSGADQQAAGEKRALDQQLANIETWKANQHAAYEAGKIDAAAWRVAELQATDAAAVAHEDYLRKLVELYTRAGQTVKAHAAAEELATLETKNAAKATDELATAMNKHREATMRVREEYAHLVEAGVAKDFEATAKAAEKLAAAEDELTKAQGKLAEVRISQFYKDQEAAITKLAQMHLITEQQKDDRLKLLEEKQANDAIAILDNQLREEESRVAEASKKIAAMKLSPNVSNAEILEAEANLKKLETAVTNTEAEIVATKEKFNKQSEADDKSHYGRALLIAMASGKELLAEQLKQNHAMLLAAQANLADAKARGLDTTAIHQQITALKQHEQELSKQASGNKAVLLAEEQVTHAKLLAAQAILAEARARGLNTTAIEKEIRDLQSLEKLMKQQPADMQKVRGGLEGLRMSYQELGQMVKSTEQQMSQAFATAIMGALESSKSIGAALEAATKQVLLNLAEQALAKAIFYTAEGIAATVFDPPAAAAYFAAAGEFALVAGAAGAVGLAIPGANSGGGSSAAGPVPGQGGGNVNLGGSSGSNQTVGVTHLAAGGVVSRRLMIGDSPSGGDADEAILPLSDAGAMSKIVNAILPVLPQNAPGFGFATPAQSPPKGFDRSQPSESDRPDIHSGNPNDGDFERSEASIPRDMEGLEALAARFGGLLSTPTLRAAAGSRGADIAAATAASPTGFDSNSMEKFADRIGKQIESRGIVRNDGEGALHINMPNLKGVVSPESLKKVFKQAGRLVQNRRLTFTASNSLRITKRSQ